ncbi:hypothetical protein AB0O34_11205 [Sphaerisporangium sp. NPDC088356]|uniref:hypothetical protein n=1 Tax=Sphaerisporangium sp. NPDC088356 TaxID=3154871 RepID=UPI00343A6F7E
MTDAEAVDAAPMIRYDPDRPLPLHPLVYLADGEEVTVGRPDTDSYGGFPPDGAELVRRLEQGATPREVAAWYEQEYHESVDMDDVIAALHELDFIRSSEEPESAAAPLRWRRLSRAVFSVPAWIIYGALVAWAMLAMAWRHDLVPNYRHVFFTEYYTIIQATLFVAAIPQLLLHESFHALAGRRLGLRSRLSIGRRLYFIVLETSLDGLVAVPRRKRYLPIVAGILADVVVMAVLTIVADLTREPGGAFSSTGRFCLAFAFAILLRILWQFSFYLRTDLYVLIVTALGCVDLHTTAKRMLSNRVNRLLGRRHRLHDEADWHPVDRRVARWYSWLIVVGYTVSLTTFVAAVVPVVYQMFTGVLSRFTGGGATWAELLDSIVFAGFILVQLAVLGWMALRDRYRRREQRLYHVIA